LSTTSSERPSFRRRVRRLVIRLIGLTMGGLVVVLLAAVIEGASWGVLTAKGKITEPFGSRYQPRTSYQYFPYIGYRYAPFRKDVRTGLDTDRHGFIHNGDADRDLSTKAPGVYRIFLVGGSNVAGDTGGPVTISGRLEARLNETAEPGRRYEVVNAGVSGWLSSQELAFITYYVADFQPDLIISFNGFTDVYQAIRAPREGYGPNANNHLTSAARAAFVHTYSVRGTFAQALGLLTARSYVTEVLDELTASVRYRVGGTPAPEADDAPPPGLGSDPLRYHRQNHRLILAAASALRVPILSALQPTVLRSKSLDKPYRQVFIQEVDMSWSRIDFWSEKDRLYAEARAQVAAAAAEWPAGCQQLVRDYSTLFDTETEPAYPDQGHFTVWANDRIAAAMADDLRMWRQGC